MDNRPVKPVPFAPAKDFETDHRGVRHPEPEDRPEIIVEEDEPPFDYGLLDPCADKAELDEAEDAGDDEWSVYDEHRWGITPVGEPASPFADWIAVQASLVRMQRTDAAAWLASKIDALAEQARHLDAQSPDAFDDRRAALRDAAGR